MKLRKSLGLGRTNGNHTEKSRKIQKKVVNYRKIRKIQKKVVNYRKKNNFKVKNITIFTRGLLSIKKRFK